MFKVGDLFLDRKKEVVLILFKDKQVDEFSYNYKVKNISQNSSFWWTSEHRIKKHFEKIV
jgi:hypothetical protein